MLEAICLEKFYGERKVIKKVSLEVKPNQIVGLLGSGARKNDDFLYRFQNINLNIIVFKKDRNINQRIEYSGIKLTIQDIDRAIDKFIECLEL